MEDLKPMELDRDKSTGKTNQWLIIGIASLGALIGIVSGISSASVTLPIMAALFSILGGGATSLFATSHAIMNPRVFGMTLAAFSISTIIFLVVGIQIKEYELLSPKRPGQEASLPLYLKSEQLSKRSAIEGLCRNNDYDVLVEMMRGKGK